MITWQPAPASTWQLCEGQRGLAQGTEATRAAAMRAVEGVGDGEG